MIALVFHSSLADSNIWQTDSQPSLTLQGRSHFEHSFLAGDSTLRQLLNRVPPETFGPEPGNRITHARWQPGAIPDF